MSADVSLFLFAITNGGILLFLSIFTLITLSDLECDQINVKECCQKLKLWVIPEFIAYFLLIFLFFFTNHFILFLFHLPLAIYMVYLLTFFSKGTIHFYNENLLIEHNTLKKYIKAIMFKLINYLILFFIYLYNLTIILGTMF